MDPRHAFLHWNFWTRMERNFTKSNIYGTIAECEGKPTRLCTIMPTKPGHLFSFCNEFQDVVTVKDPEPVFKREDMEIPEELFSKPVVPVNITPSGRV